MSQASNAHYLPALRQKIEFSRHAAKRSQQRAIPADALPLLLAYGERSHDGRGGVRYMMTHSSLAAVARAVGRSQRLDALAGAYAVVSADDERAVITVGHRYS
jgi:hypothetical protein